MNKRGGKCYGDILTSYSGKGVITNSAGNQYDCDFSAHQLATGKVVLLVEILDTSSIQSELDIVEFSGIDTGGSSVSVKGNIRGIRYLPKLPNSSCGVWGAYYVDQLRIDHRGSDSESRIFKFGLTNLEFIGTPKRTRTGTHSNEVLLDLKGSDIPIVRLQRTHGYNDRINRLKTLRGGHVTAELVSPPLPSALFPQLKQVVTDLCYILSIASGTKVNWVYCIETTPSRRKIATSHYSRITKPYSPLAPIGLDQSGDIKRFVEKVYPVYVKQRSTFALEKGIIDAYLDAKVETDYLEMRSVKMAVAIEALKQAFLDIPENKSYDLVLPEADYAPLVNDIQKEACRVLQDHGIVKNEANAIASEGKIGSLNRRSFRYVLSKLCKSLNLNLSPDTDLFIACRNSLVHQGGFYSKSATPNERAQVAPLPTDRDEYFFFVHVMDRLYLKLIGYSGPYKNWRKPQGNMDDVL